MHTMRGKIAADLVDFHHDDRFGAQIEGAPFARPAQAGGNPMKQRRELSAAELESLHEHLSRQLDKIGLETQPRVALRVLQIAQDSNARVQDWAEVVKTDWALTGRLLKLANSAFYAQRAPVTKLERALVLLGTERTKAICLGFYLSRAATPPDVKDLTRRIWGQSVFRASLASALAKVNCNGLVGEAFVVGLMLDCAIPIMARLIGDDYLKLFQACDSPAKLFAAEFDRLEFTHTDIAATLARRWKLPTILARPIVWHHAPPPTHHAGDTVAALQRIAYYAGSLRLSPEGLPRSDEPLPAIAGRLFELPPGGLASIISSATTEYEASLQVFSGLADRIDQFDAVADSVQMQLVEMMDAQIERAMRLETRGGPERLCLAGQTIEVEPGTNGEVVAFIAGAKGERLLSCTVRPENETTDSIRRKLGLEDAPDGDMRQLMRVIQAMAA